MRQPRRQPKILGYKSPSPIRAEEVLDDFFLAERLQVLAEVDSLVPDLRDFINVFKNVN